MKLLFRSILTVCAASVLAIPVPAQNRTDRESIRLHTVVIDPGHG